MRAGSGVPRRTPARRNARATNVEMAVEWAQRPQRGQLPDEHLATGAAGPIPLQIADEGHADVGRQGELGPPPALAADGADLPPSQSMSSSRKPITSPARKPSRAEQGASGIVAPTPGRSVGHRPGEPAALGRGRRKSSPGQVPQVLACDRRTALGGAIMRSCSSSPAWACGPARSPPCAGGSGLAGGVPHGPGQGGTVPVPPPGGGGRGARRLPPAGAAPLRQPPGVPPAARAPGRVSNPPAVATLVVQALARAGIVAPRKGPTSSAIAWPPRCCGRARRSGRSGNSSAIGVPRRPPSMPKWTWRVARAGLPLAGRRPMTPWRPRRGLSSAAPQPWGSSSARPPGPPEFRRLPGSRGAAHLTIALALQWAQDAPAAAPPLGTAARCRPRVRPSLECRGPAHRSAPPGVAPLSAPSGRVRTCTVTKRCAACSRPPSGPRGPGPARPDLPRSAGPVGRDRPAHRRGAATCTPPMWIWRPGCSPSAARSLARRAWCRCIPRPGACSPVCGAAGPVPRRAARPRLFRVQARHPARRRGPSHLLRLSRHSASGGRPPATARGSTTSATALRSRRCSGGIGRGRTPSGGSPCYRPTWATRTWRDTYWYLTACPELLGAAVQRLEARWEGPRMTPARPARGFLERFFTQRLLPATAGESAHGPLLPGHLPPPAPLRPPAAAHAPGPPRVPGARCPADCGLPGRLGARRQITARSRNLRLTAIRSFFHYAAYEEPAHAAQISRVLAIPGKRLTRRLVTFLTRPEIDALLAAPDPAPGSAAATTPCYWWPCRPAYASPS